MRRLGWAVVGALLALAGWAGYLSGSLLPGCPAGLAKAQLCCCWPVGSSPACPCCPSEKAPAPPASEEAAEGLPPAGVCQCWPTEKYLATVSIVRFCPTDWAVWNPNGLHLLGDRFSRVLPWLCLGQPPPVKPRLQSLYCIWRK